MPSLPCWEGAFWSCSWNFFDGVVVIFPFVEQADDRLDGLNRLQLAQCPPGVNQRPALGAVASGMVNEVIPQHGNQFGNRSGSQAKLLRIIRPGLLLVGFADGEQGGCDAIHNDVIRKWGRPSIRGFDAVIEGWVAVATGFATLMIPSGVILPGMH